MGRGRSSGLGKTSGKGQKGQGAHNKHKQAGFEGGQTPLARRFPKRGFTNFHRETYCYVNVGQLEKLASLGAEIDVTLLRKKGVVSDVLAGLRVLGDGELKSALTVKAMHFSKTAKEKIEKAGGKAILLTKEAAA